jgi:hypothetical protein
MPSGSDIANSSILINHNVTISVCTAMQQVARVLLKKPVMLGSGASGPTSTSYGFEDSQTDSNATDTSAHDHHHDQYDSERERSVNSRQQLQQQSVDNKFGGWSETANQAPRGYEGGSSGLLTSGSSGSASRSKQPHMSYYFTIGSVDTFERKLEEAQKALGIKPRDYIPVQYQAESSMLIEVRTLYYVRIPCYSYVYVTMSVIRGYCMRM